MEIKGRKTIVCGLILLIILSISMAFFKYMENYRYQQRIKALTPPLIIFEEESGFIDRNNFIQKPENIAPKRKITPKKRSFLIDEIYLEEKEKPIATTEQTTPRATQPPTTTKKTTTTTTTQLGEDLPQKGNGMFLFKVSNPDPNYTGEIMVVEDRANLEGLVMGEFGTSYEGAVIVAQAIRDSMKRSGTRNTMVIKKKYGYTAPVKTNVSENVKRAVAFVFDEGGSAAQHEILYFYAFNLVKSSWHESQKFVLQFQNCRFFAPHK